jgi:RNA polymerase sigma-70 factor (ECF subfamily)
MTQEIERRLDALRRDGDLRGAATEAIESYGPEVLGWLFVTCRSRVEAEEAFLSSSEELWRSMVSFRGDCSVRTWMYLLARRALQHHRARASEKIERNRPLSEASAVADRVRSRTAPWQRTEVKERFAALRDELSEDDRGLLVLRVDKGLSWQEIARVLASDDDDPQRFAARLRKRYQAIKERLRRRAQEEGILDEDA